METHVLSCWLWAIQLAREVQRANLGPHDPSAHHCAPGFCLLPISICSALGWTLELNSGN